MTPKKMEIQTAEMRFTINLDLTATIYTLIITEKMFKGEWRTRVNQGFVKKEKGPRNEPLTLDIVFFIKWSQRPYIERF
jgi:hypothetical protein